jgi:dihydrofolate reductase
MSTVVVTNHITLDGVMQSPAAPDEDTRGGFTHGGWAAANQDEVLGKYLGERMTGGGESALLLGRRTYEHFARVWPHAPADSPFTEIINRQQKLVASRTLTGPLAWNNSRVIEGDVAEAVAAMKAGEGANLVVLGSGDLIQTLLRHDLVDEWLLMIHPLVLGTGRRLFPEGGQMAGLELVESLPTTTGVLITRYRPKGS